MSEPPTSPEQPPDPALAPTPELRAAVDVAFNAGDLKQASRLAEVLAQRRHLGVWEKAVIGRVALATDSYDQAIQWLSKAHQDNPQEGSILLSLADAYVAKNVWGAAASTLGKVIDLHPSQIDLYERQGVCLSNTGRFEEAEAAFIAALAIDASSTSVLTLLGELCLSQSREAGAKDYFLRALEFDPSNASALSNLALCYERDGDLPLALETVDRLTKLQPSHANEHRSGQLLLSLGRLGEGWTAYARRLKSPAYRSWQFALGVPYWAGEDIGEKHVLVWTDQGLGEQILTVSLLNEVIARAKAVTLACDPRLIPLFQRSWPDEAVVSLTALRDEKQALSSVDVQATLSELGAVLRPSLDAFPKPTPFLKSNPDRSAALRKQLQTDSNKPLIGLSWRSVNPLAGEQKSTDLKEHWTPVLTQPGFTFVALQYGDIADELDAVRKTLNVHIAAVPDLDFEKDVDGFAAAVAAMDGIVSISNTTVHVAGGLGIPVKAILPPAYGRPWYWFEKGSSTPWYSGVSLYRSQGHWGDIISEVANSLSDWNVT